MLPVSYIGANAAPFASISNAFKWPLENHMITSFSIENMKIRLDFLHMPLLCHPARMFPMQSADIHSTGVFFGAPRQNF